MCHILGGYAPSCLAKALHPQDCIHTSYRWCEWGVRGEGPAGAGSPRGYTANYILGQASLKEAWPLRTLRGLCGPLNFDDGLAYRIQGIRTLWLCQRVLLKDKSHRDLSNWARGTLAYYMRADYVVVSPKYRVYLGVCARILRMRVGAWAWCYRRHHFDINFTSHLGLAVQPIIPDEQPCFDLTQISRVPFIADTSLQVYFSIPISAFSLTGGMCRIYLLFTFK